jgi:2-hydroxy-3-keto-5-methylthiopentenyl-1-phosphate phosphatase
VASIICLDFDDTIVLDNTARQIFERFADPSWKEREAEYKAGRLSVEQFNAAAFDLVDPSVTGAELRSFVREVARPRPGLAALVDWAHWNGWLLVVVSNGFDFYVDTVLDDLGFDRIARHAGRTRNEYRWRVRYLSPRGIEIEDAFKLSYARAFKDAGDFVAYAGDGASDVPAARMAGAVFARSTLWERLCGEHPRVYVFESFDDIVGVLERDAQAWTSASSPA